MIETHERRERLPAPIRADYDAIDIPSIIDVSCSNYNNPKIPSIIDETWPNIPSIIGGPWPNIPSIIGGPWDFNIPSVIVLDHLEIPSVIYCSGIGD